jgi:NEDD8-activating enzyme E1 regulatory subunit
MTSGAMTPPVLLGPSAKEKKYDRQLRLWAASGQAALEDAHLLLINSGPGVLGTETLKNLVLPGTMLIAESYVAVAHTTSQASGSSPY